jgi:rfaE bifunctional protein kinase chain/domain/rfaE bifunctional protein nucleotidyltransferase chain/domain
VSTTRKIFDLPGLVTERERLRTAGKTVVQCHGCFDIVHPGHLRYFQFAKRQGDVLIISVSGDAVVGKGYDRPYIHQDLRLENLAALELVDYVVLDHNDWAGPVLDAVKPDIYVKGKEYETRADPRFAREKDLVESYGGRVIYSSGDVVYSSTAIISKFRSQFALEPDKIRLFCKEHGIDRAGVDGLLDQMRGKNVVVMGDAILDRYIFCHAGGLAAEAPVLNVTPLREQVYAGGAALIAGQVSALGGHATLLVPRCTDASRLGKELERVGVTLESAGEAARDVMVKTRYLVDDRKVLKVDEGRYAPLAAAEVHSLLERLRELLVDADALIITDFGYGMFGSELAAGVAEAASAAGVPYFADVSGSRASILKFKGSALSTPTERELRHAFADEESGLAPLALRFYRETGAHGLCITLGKRGVLLFEAPASDDQRLRTAYLPALDSHAVDTVGAGDVFLATSVLATLANADMRLAAYVASAVSAVHVSRIGNEPIDLIDVGTYLDGRGELLR